MNQKISQRYQKALVTVAMGFRKEEDIKKNGLYRFNKDQKDNLLEYVNNLFKSNKSVLVLKVKQIGYRSEHINITSEEDLIEFINNLDNIFGKDNEIWVVSSSIEECFRARLYISKDNINDTIEMAYSFDDHVLDHINENLNIPYIYYKVNGKMFNIIKSTLNEELQKQANINVNNILSTFMEQIKCVREDLEYIGIDGISIDIRINNGYDFHDFDVSYNDVEKVIKYYMNFNLV